MLCILKKIIHKLHYSTNIVKYYNPSNFIYIYIYIYNIHQPLAMGWTVLGSNFGGGGEISPTRPDRPWDLPGLLYNGYRVILGD